MPRLDWIGKKGVENHHRQVLFYLLREVLWLSVGDPESEICSWKATIFSLLKPFFLTMQGRLSVFTLIRRITPAMKTEW